MSDEPYKLLRDTMRELAEMINSGPPRYALVSRMGGLFQLEQVAGRPRPALDMDRIRAAVAARLREIGSGNQATNRHSDTTRRSAAP